MLNDIRLHVDEVEARQLRLEREFAESCAVRERANIIAFRRYIPSIASIYPSIKRERLSVFVDKNAETNIVNLANGATLYDFPVDATIQTQVNNWAAFSARLNLGKSSVKQTESEQVAPTTDYLLKGQTFADYQSYIQALANDRVRLQGHALVILGLGKGAHLPELIDTFKPKQVVVYEPDWEVFKCSMALFDWSLLLRQLAEKGIQIFLQIGESIYKIFDEINELHEHLKVNELVFYQHQINPLYCQIIERVRAGKWHSSIAEMAQNNTRISSHLHHHLRFFNSLAPQNLNAVKRTSPLFTANMALFERHFPDIHAAFTDYSVHCWEVVEDKCNQQINLFNRESACFLAGNEPAAEGQAQAAHFAKHPNIDGLVFGHQGDKLRHYMHNQFVRKVDLDLKEHRQEERALPDGVKMLLVFGLGSGYMLEALHKSHDIQNILICEPNPDFFYASLHAIDWAPIFSKIEQCDYKLYLNIGESSSRLFKDLTVQFMSLGPHLLNETYILQSYDNPLLRSVLKDVRQQLQVIFSMGENLDHVLYGISHTVQAIEDGIPMLIDQPSKVFSHVDKQLPVFIVGNGPSLDESIDLIREHQDQALVISCGTSLQALYSNGIKPDFHAEVEQNRANFDWLNRIGDPDYLKQISLLSVNGIHPDTYKLFKQSFMVFKSGESATQTVLAMFAPNTFTSLDDAYPTVTNMTLSLMLTMGFEQIYLHGIDLGFADETKHHSVASGYYEQGKQVFNYKKMHEGLQQVRGNRQALVSTKTEFNISRMLFEQVIANYKAECFNLSNGAFINGTNPLLPENVLILSTNQQKQTMLEAFEKCFVHLNTDIVDQVNAAYDHDKMHKQLQALQFLTKQFEQTTLLHKHQVDDLINQVRELFMQAKRTGGSLFFYYMYNSASYLCAVLSKAIMHDDESVWPSLCASIIKDWHRLMADFNYFVEYQFSIKDIAECLSNKHEERALASPCHQASVDYYTLNGNLSAQYALFVNENARTGILRQVDDLRVPSDSFLVIDIFSSEEAELIIQNLQSIIDSSGEDANNIVNCENIGLVFHQYALLEKTRERFALTALANVCFVYMPVIWQRLDMENYAELSEACLQGYQDYLARTEYFNFLQARAAEFPAYSTLIYKLRFHQTASLLINKTSETDTKEFTQEYQAEQKNRQLIENIDDFSHYYDVDSTIILDSSAVNARFDANFLMHEFKGRGFQIIENKIIKYLNADMFYTFKHYIAVPKDTYKNDTSAVITRLDKMHNRSLLLRRKPCAYDLYGQWYLH